LKVVKERLDLLPGEGRPGSLDGVGGAQGELRVPPDEAVHKPFCGKVVLEDGSSALLVQVRFDKMTQVLTGEREAPFTKQQQHLYNHSLLFLFQNCGPALLRTVHTSAPVQQGRPGDAIPLTGRPGGHPCLHLLDCSLHILLTVPPTIRVLPGGLVGHCPHYK